MPTAPVTDYWFWRFAAPGNASSSRALRKGTDETQRTPGDGAATTGARTQSRNAAEVTRAFGVLTSHLVDPFVMFVLSLLNLLVREFEVLNDILDEGSRSSSVSAATDARKSLP